MDYPTFRAELDRLLRSKDPAAVRQFLITQGAWTQENPADVEHAMWVMIVGSPALRSLHAEALGWLRAHGYQAEVEVLARGEPGTNKERPPKGGGKPNAASATPRGGKGPKPAR